MRISNIQNFAANSVSAMNKCCKPRKSVENNQAQNSLEHFPAMDTVSFGKFGRSGKNGYEDDMAKVYVRRLFVTSDVKTYEAIRDSIHLDVTTKDLKNNVYSASLVSLEALQPGERQSIIESYDETITDAYKEFNEENGLDEGWERNLHDEKDFRLLAKLARHLNHNGYFSGKRESRLDDFGDPYSDSAGITGRWIF